MIPGVVVTPHQIHPLLKAVDEAGVVAPGDALAMREPPRPLRLEVEQTLLQRVLVVMPLPLGSKHGRRRSSHGAKKNQQHDPEPAAQGGAHCTTAGARYLHMRLRRLPPRRGACAHVI
uniref:Uncharacterized protein n=1 Tax=Arundo donax TaxID=35708 RepID=A0A0A8XQN2_ARUDO